MRIPSTSLFLFFGFSSHHPHIQRNLRSLYRNNCLFLSLLIIDLFLSFQLVFPILLRTFKLRLDHNQELFLSLGIQSQHNLNLLQGTVFSFNLQYPLYRNPFRAAIHSYLVYADGRNIAQVPSPTG